MAIGRSFSVGIDIGTSQVKVLVAEYPSQNPQTQNRPSAQAGNQSGNSEKDSPRTISSSANKADANTPRIVSTGVAETKGMRHGYITNVNEVAKSIRSAVDQAQRGAGTTIKRAFVSVGGIGLGAIISTGSVNTTKADSEITDLDVKRAIDESEKDLPHVYIQNRKIIHTIPLEYRIDGKRVLGKPQGLKGLRLEARVLYITCLSHHLSDILLALEEADIEALDVIASPMAGSAVTLQKTQKIAGCLFANIGSETTSIMVFENNIPISMEVFPFGSNDVTNDIALGLKVSLEDADEIKRGNDRGLIYSKKKLDEIVIARLSDIFDLIDDHLKRIDRSGLLPAGITITGGGAGLQNIDELAKIALHLPAKQATLSLLGNTKGILHDNEWSTAYGLAVLGLSNDDNSTVDIELLGVKRIFEKTGKSIWAWIKKFLP